MQELERGKLYQVLWRGDWLIAEYVRKMEAYTATGINADGRRTWKEPSAHWWKTVPGSNSFSLYDRGIQVRPVTEETLAEITQLRAEADELGRARGAKLRDVLNICGSIHR